VISGGRANWAAVALSRIQSHLAILAMRAILGESYRRNSEARGTVLPSALDGRAGEVKLWLAQCTPLISKEIKASKGK
jgi:hypothetical protein